MSDQDQANTSLPPENSGPDGSAAGGNSGSGDHVNRAAAVPALSERMNVRMAALGITPPLPPQSAYRTEEMPPPPTPAKGRKARKQGRSQSVWQRRWGRFKSIKRGYYAFLLLVALYLLSFFLPILVNSK